MKREKERVKKIGRMEEYLRIRTRRAYEKEPNQFICLLIILSINQIS